MATQAAPNGVRWVDGMDDSQKYAFDLVRTYPLLRNSRK
jgi:hypothetical protein